MTIAVPIERFAGDVIGVLQAEVNLKYIGDVVSAIKIGQAGYAYLVTRSGDLIAHPDISLVLQRRNMSSLPQARAAFSDRPQPGAIVGTNLQGRRNQSRGLVRERLHEARRYRHGHRHESGSPELHL
jgi:hypothetical protein